MATKKIVQDIVPSAKHSIREISIDDGIYSKPKINKRKTISKPIEDDTEGEIEEESYDRPVRKPKIKKKVISLKYLLAFIVIFASVLVIGVALSLSYSKAVVTITPKVVNFDVNGTITSKKGATYPDLGYEVISVTASSSQKIAAIKGPLIQSKAKGTVVFYNNHSETPQTLVAGTRISTTDGLVYRTTATISVPGKVTTPGSVTATVVADKTGASYNLKVSDLKGDFKLPGYKGSEKYNGFYARIKTDIVGGFSGNKMTIDHTEKAKIVQTMKDDIKANLISKLEQNVPDKSVLYDNAYNIEYDIFEPSMTGASEAEITVRGIACGAIFKTDELIKYIAGSEIRKFPSDTYRIEGEKELLFKVSNVKDFSAKKGTPLIFSIKGPIVITGNFIESDLKNELKGIKLLDSNAVFAKYKSISNAHALITPFWLRSFPNSIDRINIEYKH
jgi:hypothetical protein